jgi:RNA polymerase sigma factor (sigma-70 family)
VEGGVDKRARLSATAFEKLLAALGEDRDDAGQQYERIRRKLLRYFEYHSCPFPEDQADEVIDRVATKISDGLMIEAADPATYFYGVARYVMKEYWERQSRASTPVGKIGSTHTAPTSPEDWREQQASRLRKEREMECLEGCLKMLPTDKRELITAYYQGAAADKIASRKALAARLGASINALRSKTLRVRETLEKCLDQCLAA